MERKCEFCGEEIKKDEPDFHGLCFPCHHETLDDIEKEEW